MLQKIQKDIRTSMIEKDKDKRDVLRQVVAKAQAISKEAKCDITDDMVIRSIEKELKQLNQTKDSIPDDCDLYKSTIYKIGILQCYLPEKMSEKETIEAVNTILSSGDYKNFGEQVKAVLLELSGKADNKLIAQAVKDYNSEH
jgi:uncharacterized protein YqeY